MRSSPRPSYWRSSCRTAEGAWTTTSLSTCRQALTTLMCRPVARQIMELGITHRRTEQFTRVYGFWVAVIPQGLPLFVKLARCACNTAVSFSNPRRPTSLTRYTAVYISWGMVPHTPLLSMSAAHSVIATNSKSSACMVILLRDQHIACHLHQLCHVCGLSFEVCILHKSKTDIAQHFTLSIVNMMHKQGKFSKCAASVLLLAWPDSKMMHQLPDRVE